MDNDDADEIRPTNASLSTMWAINRFTDLNEFLRVSRQLGFQQIELNHQVGAQMLALAQLDQYQISSIHEPCPADIPSKELVNKDWIISSNDKEARRHGVDIVKNSIRLASQLNAHTVVIHCGNVTREAGLESQLRNLYKTGDTGFEPYQGLKAEICQTRANLATTRFEAVTESLHELIDFAKPLNVRLGLENRYHIMDIPDLDEMGELLSQAGPAELGFIYDVGHAEALERLGFFPHDEWLKRYETRMIGCHLHDVRGLKDHLAPGLGEIDFKWIAKFIPHEATRTMELQPGNTIAQVKNGINQLLAAGCIGYLWR
jgi:sugar phosphate isomerase/epimerase